MPNSLKLELKTVIIRNNKTDTFDFGKIEGEKFCYDIVIENMRFAGVWYFGGKEKQNEILQKIKKGISNINIERIL